MTVPYPYPEILAHRSAIQKSRMISGADTHWWVYPADRDSPIAVLIHGFRGDHHGLELFADAMSEYTVIIPDLPGFGSSSPFEDESHTIDDYGRWLRDFLAEMKLVDVPVLGHSFGSIVVANALRGPRTAPLILVNPIAQPALEGPNRIATQVASWWYEIGAKLPVKQGLSMLSWPVMVRAMSVLMAKSKDKPLRKWIHSQHDMYFSSFMDRTALLGAYYASITSNVGQYAAEIEAPTLLIAAELDDITPVSVQEDLATKFPHAELHVIPGSGHLVHYEEPILVAQHIREFLGRLAN